MTLRPPIRETRFTTVVSAFVPSPSQMTSPDRVRDKSYEDSPVFLATVQEDRLIGLGPHQHRPSCLGVLGPHGVRDRNDNGLLLRTHAEHRLHLLLASTFFRFLTRKKATWMHLRSRRWPLLDCVFVRRRGH
ncbi:hypothetical protein SprV_0501819600 [Sparganum proliferum]